MSALAYPLRAKGDALIGILSLGEYDAAGAVARFEGGCVAGWRFYFLGHIPLSG